MNSRLCFATLAFNKAYRDMAKLLASDLATHSPDHLLVVATDAVEDFKDCPNVAAFHQQRTGFFRCINDKRFAILFALENHAEETVFIDADCRIRKNLPQQVDSDSKIVTVHAPPLAEHVRSWLLPKAARAVLAAADSLGIDPSHAKLVMDHLFAVKRDNGREKIFIHVWDLLTRMFDFEGVVINDGYCMALAAVVVGWEPSEIGMKGFEEALEHRRASELVTNPNLLTKAVRFGIQKSKWMLHRRKVIRSIRSRIDGS